MVLRSWFDPAPLSVEFDAVDREAFVDATHRNSGGAGNEFRYVPVMSELMPVSLELTQQLAAVATELLASPVLPGRSKITTYFGSTQWHRDSELPVRSIGMVAYLDPVDASSGALRVAPGSHHRAAADDVELLDDAGDPGAGVAVPTTPGDVIVFDERLLHTSSGGVRRRQWRADFVADGGDDDGSLREYYQGTFSPDWDAGYDVDRFPSFGPFWRATHERWAQRLAELGALDAAQREEDAARARRAAGATEAG